MLRSTVGSQRTAVACPVHTFVARGAHTTYRQGQPLKHTPYRLCPVGFCHIGGKRVALLFGTDALSPCSIPYRNQHEAQSDATIDACAIGLSR